MHAIISVILIFQVFDNLFEFLLNIFFALWVKGTTVCEHSLLVEFKFLSIDFMRFLQQYYVVIFRAAKVVEVLYFSDIEVFYVFRFKRQ